MKKTVFHFFFLLSAIFFFIFVFAVFNFRLNLTSYINFHHFLAPPSQLPGHMTGDTSLSQLISIQWWGCQHDWCDKLQKASHMDWLTCSVLNYRHPHHHNYHNHHNYQGYYYCFHLTLYPHRPHLRFSTA